MFDSRPYRQGDVIVVPTAEAIPSLARRVPGRAVVALGEATGHGHVVEGEVELYETSAADRWLRVVSAATLVHEEHPPIALPVGTYRVRIRREYTPQEVRRVAD